jgi:murein DD-endopeptidase MepM/ murein hydrolase activator NlpD
MGQEGDSQWLSKAAQTVLRQAAVALLIFGLASFGLAGQQPYRPLVLRAIGYAALSHHTYDDITGWVLSLRHLTIPTSWPEVQEVWWRLRGQGSNTPNDPAKPDWGLIWPAQGPITSGFGWRTHPIHNDIRYHTGVDIGAAEGAQVLAARAGKVTETGLHDVWGNFVLLEHDSDSSTFYAHLAEIVVAEGQELPKGAMLGTVGKTGQVSEAHLHFEIREKGNPIDPEPLLHAAQGGS